MAGRGNPKGPPVRGSGWTKKSHTRQPRVRLVAAPDYEAMRARGGAGRPPLRVDEGQVLQLAKLGFNNTEIAAVVGVSPGTLTTRFRPVIERGRALFRVAIRLAQFERAREGSVEMLVHLGRNYLGQGGGDAGGASPPTRGFQVILTGGPPGNLQPVDDPA